MPTHFASLPHSAQTRALKPLARQAMAAFGMEDAQARLSYYGFNATYRVEWQGQMFALRININSRRTEAEIRAEAAFISHLAGAKEFDVPHPVAASDGQPLVLLASPLFPQPLSAVLYKWLPGRHLPSKVSFADMRQIGRAMAEMHQAGEHFAMPAGAMRKLCPDVMDGSEWRLPNEHPFTTVLEAGNRAVAKVAAAQAPRICHFDIHFGNVKKHQGRISIFDFDDANISWPVLDAAQSVFYFRRSPRRERVEEAFFEGLGWKPEEKGVTRAEFEALVAGRQLLLASDLMSNQTASLAAMAPRYLKTARHRLQLFLETGWFDSMAAAPPDAEGPVPDDTMTA